MRIVSLVPSLTELLYDLGLGEDIVGVTKFCVRPYKQPDFQGIRPKRIGGTKQVHVHLVQDLRPDLVIANKEENVKDQVEAIGQFCQVHVTEIRDLSDALHSITEIGTLTHRSSEAIAIVHRIVAQRQPLEELVASVGKLRVAYLIWQEPLMTVGADTFIHAMLLLSGFDNVFEDRLRYPSVSHADIAAARPDVIMLSSEPYPFKQAHIEAFARMHPYAHVLTVDGEAFAWYGSRLLHGLPYFCTLRQELQSVLGR